MTKQPKATPEQAAPEEWNEWWIRRSAHGRLLEYGPLPMIPFGHGDYVVRYVKAPRAAVGFQEDFAELQNVLRVTTENMKAADKRAEAAEALLDRNAYCYACENTFTQFHGCAGQTKRLENAEARVRELVEVLTDISTVHFDGCERPSNNSTNLQYVRRVARTALESK